VYGLGYDANDDAAFSISDGTTFNSQGFYFTTEPQDLATANGSDYYGEGWFAAFWHYGVAAANPYDGGTWSDIPVGMVGRTLTDGAWDSWTFSPTFNFSSFAENPVAAEPPFAQGDFNHDTLIDAADYGVWRSSFGSTTDPAADANHNSVVDAADYVLWRHAASSGSGASTLGSNQIPEPNTVSFVALIVMLTMYRRSSRH
jgi:hypothetical protein